MIKAMISQHRYCMPSLRNLAALGGVLLIAAMGFLPSPAQAAISPLVALDDGYFVWDTRELSVADAQAAIRQFPKLAAHEALIVDRCGLHSINPRLATVLLDASGALNDRGLETADTMRARIDAFLTALPHMFYLGRARADAARQVDSTTGESALHTTTETSGVSALAETFVPGDDRVASLARSYVERFGTRTPVATAAAQQKAGEIATTANPTNWMRLPWLLGQQGWSFNGVHSSSGSCANPVCAQPRSSIDFSNGWPAWGTSTTRSPVMAANDGVVTIFSSCNMRVTHASGWASSYYHLSNIRVADGSSVVAGQNIADFADNMAQALCQGGSSTGPHVHFTLINAGAQVDINQSDFSGWRVNATSVIRDYDSDCSRMNLTRDGNTPCPYVGNSPTAWSMHTLATGMASNKLCDLDVDGNGVVSITTDGVLLTRYLLGLRGPSLVSGAIGSGATRNTNFAIESFIASKRHDFDGDNLVLTQTDGLLALRLMLGLTGTSLASGATVASSLLTTSAQINALVAGCR